MELYDRLLEFLPEEIKLYLRMKESQLLKKHKLAKWHKLGCPIPPPHEVKQQVIQDFKNIFGHEILIETGTYLGYMMFAQRKYFEQLISIELDKNLYEKAVRRFKKFKNIRIEFGDSSVVLKTILQNISDPCVFWLDGHYSGDGTAKGDLDCPIYAEILAIFDGETYPHVLLIDDARMFVGTNDYPTIAELTAFIIRLQPNYKLEVKDDIIRIFPKK